jgi:uncharacterized protein YaaN involved in tellurite resistance
MSEALQTEIKFENALVPSPPREILTEKVPGDAQSLALLEKAKAELSFDDSQSLVFFGAKVQTGLGEITTKMISGVRNKDIGPAADALSKVVLNIRGFRVDDIEKPQGMMAKAWNAVMHAATPLVVAWQRYESVDGQINVIVSTLDRHVGVLMRDVTNLDQLYAEALADFKMLKIYIAAGEAILEDVRTNRIAPMIERAKRDNDAEVSQHAARLEALAQRLERRIHDFRLTRQATLDTLPMIMLMQDNDSNIVEKIQSTIMNTIPLWRRRIAMLITQQNAEGASDAVSAVSDVTNELMVSTAKSFEKSNKVIRDQIERGIFDLDAIRSANQSAIQALEDTRTAYSTAKQRRTDEVKELAKYETALITAMSTQG